MKIYLMEAIGTFFLVLTIALTANPVAIAGVLAAMIYIGAPISGAQYNPAVSIALSSIGKQPWKKTTRYILAQLGGSLLGVVVAHALSGTVLIVAPGEGVSMYQSILAEGIFTFALVSAVLHTAVSKKAAGNSYFGLAIALTVLAGAYSVGSISGGAFNPAVGTGPAIYGLLLGKGVVLEYILLYLIGPILGGVLAAQFYQFTHPHEHRE